MLTTYSDSVESEPLLLIYVIVYYRIKSINSHVEKQIMSLNIIFKFAVFTGQVGVYFTS